MFFLIVPFRYASLHNEKKHQQRGETLQLFIKNNLIELGVLVIINYDKIKFMMFFLENSLIYFC